MGKSIVVTSGKGGVGKTTTTANIGVSLALMGKRVCLIDMDIGLRNLDVILGLDNRIMYNILDVCTGRVHLRQALVKDKRFDDLLYLLPATQKIDRKALTPKSVKKIVDELKPHFDYVLIDSPAGIEEGFLDSVAGADAAIIVTTPEISAVRDADRVIGLLAHHPLKEEPKLLINRIRRTMIASGDVMDVDDITDHLGISLLGIIFDDDAVISTSNHGEPIVLNADNPASKGYRDVARRLEGQTVPLMRLGLPAKRSWWQKILDFFSFKK